MSAIDDLNNLSGSLAGRAGAFDPALQGLQGMFGGAANSYQQFLDNQNTATGLSPEAMSALRTQGTSGINDQYQGAAQAMNSQLLRRGAAGMGQLPGSGGDISRAYQPLYSAMEAAKTKAQTDTIMADEAAKRQSLYQNQQLAMQAAGNIYGTANTLYNSGNSALTGAAGITNQAGELEGPSWGRLIGTAALNSLFNPAARGPAGAPGTGQSGGILSGGGIDGKGNFGYLGDLLGGIFGGGNKPSNGVFTNGGMNNDADALSRVDWGANNNASAMGDVRDLVGKVAGNDGAGLADAFAQLPINAGGTNTGTGEPGSDAQSNQVLKTVEGLGLSTATKAMLPHISAVMHALPGIAHGLMTNPWTAVVGAGIVTAIAWTKSQAHWEANTWTKGFQTPFDENMASIHSQVNQLKASGQYTPQVAQQVQSATKQALDGYLQKLDTFYREKGTNSDQGKVAAQAYQTFLKYYGDGGQGYLNQLAA